MSTTTETTALREQIAVALEENAAQIERGRAKGRLYHEADGAMIDAYEAFLASGHAYPATHERGVWFPDALRALATIDGLTNPSLAVQYRRDFAQPVGNVRDGETELSSGFTCPAWRTRGW